MKTVGVIGTFDSKGTENKYFMDELEKQGVKALSIDIGTLNSPVFKPDVTLEEVLMAGGQSLAELEGQSRDQKMDMVRECAVKKVMELYSLHKIDGVAAMAGGQGTWMLAPIYQNLPLGVPKLLISTYATVARFQDRFAGMTDTLIVNPVVDVSGLNPILKTVLKEAAGAIAGMVSSAGEEDVLATDKKRVGITMWGVTTPCVNRIQKVLEETGKIETYVFHATGYGGDVMEALLRQGILDGVIDLTLPEITVPLAGGIYPPDKGRLLEAVKKGIPQIVVPGGIDMIETCMPIHEKFSGRKIYMHNANLPFIRSNKEDNILFAKTIAKRLENANDKTCILLPLRGFSASDHPGNDFYDKETDMVFVQQLEEEIGGKVKIEKADHHINDPEFAELVAGKMIELLG